LLVDYRASATGDAVGAGCGHPAAREQGHIDGMAHGAEHAPGTEEGGAEAAG
jgi:hypothetical protein